MAKERQKKGIFERFMGKSKTRKESSCCSCCNFQIEDIPEKEEESKQKKD